MRIVLWLILVVGVAPAIWSAVVAYDILSRTPVPRRYSKGPLPRRPFLQVLRGSSEDGHVHDTYVMTIGNVPISPRLWAIGLVGIGVICLAIGFAFLVHFPPKVE